MLPRTGLARPCRLGAVAPAAACSPQQVCPVHPLHRAPPAELLHEAATPIAAQGCAPGDALMVSHVAFAPRAAAEALCRRGAAVQPRNMPGDAGMRAQLDGEPPLEPAPRGSHR